MNAEIILRMKDVYPHVVSQIEELATLGIDSEELDL